MEILSETPHGHVDVTIHGVENVPVPDMDAAAGRSLFCFLTTALLLFYHCFTNALLLFLLLRLMWMLLQQWTPSSACPLERFMYIAHSDPAN